MSLMTSLAADSMLVTPSFMATSPKSTVNLLTKSIFVQWSSALRRVSSSVSCPFRIPFIAKNAGITLVPSGVSKNVERSLTPSSIS